MPAKLGFVDYLGAAFNARPLGMFVAPNWIGLGAFGLLGLMNPGFWVLGAGLELGYLLALSTNPRFQRAIASKPLSAARSEWNDRIQRLTSQLNEDDSSRYAALAERCRSIIDLQVQGTTEMPAGVETQADSLGRLSWMFLRLLSSKARRSRPRSSPRWISSSGISRRKRGWRSMRSGASTRRRIPIG